MVVQFLLIVSVLSLSDFSCNNAYCSSCDSKSLNCTSCIDNYMLDNGNCIYKRDLGCEGFIVDSQKCYSCTDGYMFDFVTGKCVIGDEKCEYFSNQCEFCIEGKSVGTTKCIDCSKSNKYCYKLKAEDCSECVECMPGTKNEGGICKLVQEFCAEFTGDTCDYCYPGYFLQNGKCIRGSIENCYKYTNETFCYECEENYFSLNGVCIQCDVMNCKQCKGNSKTCSLCKSNYRVQNNQCEKCSDINCYYCNNDKNYCDYCKKGFITQNNLCYNPISGCSEYETVETQQRCKSCQEGFNNENGICIAVACKVSYDSNYCIECTRGYYIAKNYKCLKCDSKCVDGCENNSTNCIALSNMRNVKNCKYYNENRDCIVCNPGKLLINGECVESPIECYKKTITGKCVVCSKEEGIFYLPDERHNCIETNYSSDSYSSYESEYETKSSSNNEINSESSSFNTDDSSSVDFSKSDSTLSVDDSSNNSNEMESKSSFSSTENNSGSYSSSEVNNNSETNKESECENESDANRSSNNENNSESNKESENGDESETEGALRTTFIMILIIYMVI